MNKNVKHVFPGGNTTKGFVSFYDNILPQDEANHIFCIKGGPGVGKSSLMKKIGNKMLDLGYDVEFHHCSSDPNSLDAVVIKDLKIALLDGTSPHVVDPINPGAVDEIINLGEHWDFGKMKKNKKNIIKTNTEIRRHFEKAYKYLIAAKAIYDTIEKTEKLAFKENDYNKLINDTIDKLFKGSIVKEKMGKVRHLFGFAITPNGIIDYRDSFIDGITNRWVIHDSPGASSEKIMNEVVNHAIKYGYKVEAYHSPIDIEKIEDIIIEELSIIVSVDNNYHKVNFEYNNIIDLRELLDKDIHNLIIEEINKDKEIFDMLLYKAISFITKAKALHDLLEENYIPNMNFEEVDMVMDKIIDRILSLKE